MSIGWKTCGLALPCMFKLLLGLIPSVAIASATNIQSDTSISDNGLTKFHMVMNRPKGTPYYEWAESIYTEVFTRLNIDFYMDYSPLKRASIEANEGRMDGEPLRIKGYNRSFPNLIRIKESVVPMSVRAYTAKDDVPHLDGWDSLLNSSYQIVYPRGMKVCENNLFDRVNKANLSDVTETLQGLRRVAKKRIDIYIDDMNAVAPMLEKLKTEFNGTVRVAGIMENVPLYLYIHKNHKHLEQALSQTIRDIKSEGLIEKFRQEAFRVDSK